MPLLRWLPSLPKDVHVMVPLPVFISCPVTARLFTKVPELHGPTLCGRQSDSCLKEILITLGENHLLALPGYWIYVLRIWWPHISSSDFVSLFQSFLRLCILYSTFVVLVSLAQLWSPMVMHFHSHTPNFSSIEDLSSCWSHLSSKHHVLKVISKQHMPLLRISLLTCGYFKVQIGFCTSVSNKGLTVLLDFLVLDVF